MWHFSFTGDTQVHACRVFVLQAVQKASAYEQEAIQVQGLQSRVTELSQHLVAATEVAQLRQAEVNRAQDKYLHMKRKLTHAEKVCESKLPVWIRLCAVNVLW
jgi:hypothetical protein